jgi:hypothetical protein
MKGSLTVEAAFVFPFCFLIIGIIYALGIFLYNQSVLKLTGYECIVQTMEDRDQKEEILLETLLQRAEETGKSRTLGIDDLNAIVRITATKITLKYQCVQRILNLPMEVSVVCDRVYPEMSLRLMREIVGE